MNGPTASVHFRQNTGMLVMRQSKEWVGSACKPCGKRFFWKSTLHTMFLGWWGTISFIVTPFFILGNISSLFGVLRLPAASMLAADSVGNESGSQRPLLSDLDRERVKDDIR